MSAPDARPRNDSVGLVVDGPGGSIRPKKTIAARQRFRMAVIRGVWYDPPWFGPAPLPEP